MKMLLLGFELGVSLFQSELVNHTPNNESEGINEKWVSNIECLQDVKKKKKPSITNSE